MNSLEEAINAYKSALDSLTGSTKKASAADVFSALVARETIARHVVDGFPGSATLLERLTELDRHLKKHAASIVRLTKPGDFTDWRESVQPKKSAWWWFLDHRIKRPLPKINTIWLIITGFLFALALGIAWNTFQKVRGGPVTFWQSFSASFSLVLTLLAGAPLVQLIRETFRPLEESERARGILRVWMPLGAVLLIALVSLGSWYYINRAREASDEEIVTQLVKGIKHGQRAFTNEDLEHIRRVIELNPTHQERRFEIALIYEQAGQYAFALAEYQKLLAHDEKYCPAYEGIARIYLWQYKDYNGALRELSGDYIVFGCDQKVYSNEIRGQAYLGLNNLESAEDSLREAIGDYDPADENKRTVVSARSFCLLAQVLEARKSDLDGPLKLLRAKNDKRAQELETEAQELQDEAERDWSVCVQNSFSSLSGWSQPEDSEMLRIANEHLRQANLRKKYNLPR
jgi:tetratricopeptide (TPR) repeat protein